MTGFILASMLLILIVAGLVGSLASSEDDEKITLKNNSILVIDLSYQIPERSNKDIFADLSFLNSDEENEGHGGNGLNEILSGIEKASKDEHIKGIMLDLSFSPNSYAVLEPIRRALIEFKKSKKFIVAYGEMMEEHSYYIGSVADKIYLNPTGDILFNGMSYSSMYFKNMLDKLGVEVELIRHGKFKAAAESFISDKMSNENRIQIETFVGSIYHQYIHDIAVSRKKTDAEMLEINDQLKVRSGKDAIQYGLIDGLKYKDEVVDELKRLSKTAKDKDFNKVTISQVLKANPRKYEGDKNKIAVVYATGDIVSGESDDQTMGSETICKAIEKARKDEKVKAIVLRINSPGGSALASDVIWREVILTKKVKPVVVSMSSVAASGGYYIAAPANRIFAEATTITGSIGVFGMMVNASKLLKEKIGINVEKVNFGKYADLGSADRALTEDEKAIIQQMIDRIYDDFISRVSEGRKLTKAQVDSIAQGRVWAGTDALKIGLVDELGGLDKALSYAAKISKAGSDYKISEYPEEKNNLEQMLKSISKNASAYWMKQQVGEEYQHYLNLKKALRYNGVQARMLWEGNIN